AAGARVSESPRARIIAVRQARQPIRLLCGRREEGDVVGAERVVGPHGDADGGVAAVQLLDDEGVGDVVEPGAAVLLGYERAEESEGTQLGDDRVGKLVALAEGRDLIAQPRLCAIDRALADGAR